MTVATQAAERATRMAAAEGLSVEAFLARNSAPLPLQYGHACTWCGGAGCEPYPEQYRACHECGGEGDQ